MAAIMWFEF